MEAEGIDFQLSDAYREVEEQRRLATNVASISAKPGVSGHGWGGAIDFGNLYSIVGGSTTPTAALTGRKTVQYERIAEIGAKYGWYNPWRLSDRFGTDEVWHFEWWGNPLDLNVP